MSKEIITKKDVEKYATWVLNDCMHPHDEIEWLVNTILNSGCVELSFIKTIVNQIK